MNETVIIIFTLASLPTLLEKRYTDTINIFSYLSIMLISSVIISIITFVVFPIVAYPVKLLVAVFIPSIIGVIAYRISKSKFFIEGLILLFYISHIIAQCDPRSTDMLIQAIIIPILFILYLMFMIYAYRDINEKTLKCFRGLPLIFLLSGILGLIVGILQ